MRTEQQINQLHTEIHLAFHRDKLVVEKKSRMRRWGCAHRHGNADGYTSCINGLERPFICSN